jgi:hypothetical protein
VPTIKTSTAGGHPVSNRKKDLLNTTVTPVSGKVPPNSLALRCDECGRRIADPTSMHLGLHPACRAKRKMREVEGPDQPDLFWGDERAEYSVHVVDGVICVVDKQCGRSVTSDVVRIVEHLVSRGYDFRRMPLIYRDNRNIWDRVEVIDGQFARFRAVNKVKELRALRKAEAAFESKTDPAPE